MASSSFNPFLEEEDPAGFGVATSSHTKSKSDPKKKRELKRKPSKKKDHSLPKLLSSGSDSDSDAAPITPTIKRRKAFAESEDEFLNRPVRAAKLRSFLSQRVASGYTSQSDPSRRGKYFFELRVYNTDEVEKVPSIERWKHAFLTVKLGTDSNTIVWKTLTKLVNDSKEEFKTIQPILYPTIDNSK